MKLGQYCQRQRCRHAELKQFWQAFASRGFVSDSWAFLLHFTRTLTSKHAYWANDVTVDVISYPTCLFSLHYKSVYFIVTCHRQRSTKLSTTYANVWTHAFRPIWWTFWAYYAN